MYSSKKRQIKRQESLIQLGMNILHVLGIKAGSESVFHTSFAYGGMEKRERDWCERLGGLHCTGGTHFV